MRELSHAEMLAIWETGRRLAPLDRAVLLAALASDSAEGNPADWPLGKRNCVLARIHCAAFGGQLRGWTQCSECGEQLEFGFDAEAMAARDRMPMDQYVAVGKWTFRLPTSRVLAAAAAEESETAATRSLLTQCWAGPEPLAASWSEEEVEAIEARLAEADPLAEIRLHFDCPTCRSCFDESLDVGAFVWAEVERSVWRTLREIHALASAYGWSEKDILSLSPERRASYIEMVQA